jgi:hypothetical protein
MGSIWQQVLVVLATLLVIATAIALLGLLLLHRSLRQLRVPAGADFATTLRIVPLSLVVILDLLDFGLDVFATPITWVVLSRYRLEALRNVAAVEDLIPGTQLIPTMTLAWLAVRVLGLGHPRESGSEPSMLVDAEHQTGEYHREVVRRRRIL